MSHRSDDSFIFLEVNEVPFTIWDRYAQRHPSSAIATLLSKCHQLTTTTADLGFESFSDSGSPHHPNGHLTPWTTWPTVHRGVTNAEHRILDIGQDLSEINQDYPPIWQLLADSGVSTGVFGSLHSYPAPIDNPGNYSFYVPDPFATTSETIPPVAESFQAFSLGATRASGRNVGGVDKAAALRFLKSAPKLGLRPTTVAKLTKQLLSEKTNSAFVSRRRVFQSVIGFDLYLKLIKKTTPTFSTFFVNHVAAAMHRYWAAAYPEDYTSLKVTPEWTADYENEIDFAMGAIDDMVKELVAFCDSKPGYRLAIASSMGQAPTVAKQVDTELAIGDLGLFMSEVGVPAHAWSSAASMFPNYNFTVSPQYQDQFRSAIKTLRVADKPVDHREASGGFFSLDFGQPNLQSPTISLRGESVAMESLGIVNMPIKDLSLKCADHTAAGSLLVYVPNESRPVQDRREVQTTQIAPAILKQLGCDIPTYMSAESIPGLVS